MCGDCPLSLRRQGKEVRAAASLLASSLLAASLLASSLLAAPLLVLPPRRPRALARQAARRAGQPAPSGPFVGMSLFYYAIHFAAAAGHIPERSNGAPASTRQPLLSSLSSLRAPPRDGPALPCRRLLAPRASGRGARTLR